MRILQLISSTNIGGSPIHTLLLCQELKKLGCYCLIISPPGGSFEPEIKKSGIDWIPLKLSSPFRFSLYKQLAHIIQTKQIELIHTHELKADFIGTVLALKTRLPLLTTIHNMINKGTLPGWKKLWYIWLTRLIAYRQNKIITVSDAVRKNTIEHLNIPPNKIITIRNGTKILELSDPFDSAMIKKQLGLNPDRPIIALISRLIPQQKGHTYFLLAAKKVLELRPETQFLVVGDGSARQELENLTQELGIGTQVYFVGWKYNPFEILRCIDICAVPSLWDPLPRIILEAMVAMKPVVATNIDGIPEAVIDGVTGILVPPADEQQLATAFLELLSHPEKAKQMGIAGRNRAIAEFSSQHHAQEVLNLYKNEVK